jgi:predicted TPR repeat methyltransferase
MDCDGSLAVPRDLLQIAIEHHRAGRLREAEGGYRALISQSPEDAEALHLLGVLAEQVGRAGDAVPLLERAARLRPGDAAIFFNLGHAYGQCGRIDQAIEAFTRSLEIEPGRTATMIDLGLALLARQRQGGTGDAERAMAVLWKAQANGGLGERAAVVQHGLSVALLITGQIEQSIAAARSAIAAKGDYAAAHHQLGLALVARRDIAAARQSLEKAIELRQGPGEQGGGGGVESVQALAMLEVEAGNLPRAETLFRRIVSDNPAHASAWRGLGQVLTRQGKHAAALSAMAEAVRAARVLAPAAPSVPAESLTAAAARATDRLTPSSEAAELHFALATEAKILAPSRVPAAVVAELFDRYAPRFDEHLRDKLAYRVPERVAEAVARHMPGEAGRADVLDIGCGTGLCGVLLRPMAKSLTGVDLSSAMIEQTRKRNIYDHLHVGDLLATLSAADCQYDLIVAADVLIYHGDLSQIFESAMGALRPSGLFVFSIESSQAERYQLQPSRRYGHSRAYIDRLIGMYGWETVAMEDIAIREEKRQPVPGFLAVLRRA